MPLGPEPRYFTRWGWCWLILFFGAFGALGYLLLGVTTPTPPDEAPEGRASGGVAPALAPNSGLSDAGGLGERVIRWMLRSDRG